MTENQPTSVFSYDGIRPVKGEAAAAGAAFTYDSQGLESLDREQWAVRPKPGLHPLLGDWGDYAIHAVVWHAAAPGREASLEVELWSAARSRRLRFLGVEVLRLRLGSTAEAPCHDTRMMDVTCRGDARRRVEVWSGQFGDPISLYARQVVEMRETGR